jgi:hypothetical protein
MIGKTIFNTTSPKHMDAFIGFVQQRLHHQRFETFDFNRNENLRRISAVLFLLGVDAGDELSLILNQRSRFVRQPGDLCCPGGGITPIIDAGLARWLDLPTSPLSEWPYRKWWRRYHQRDFAKLKLLLATALREGLEEMRLNPFGVRFMGRLPVQHLVMFKRSIYPLVGWVNRQQRFFTNWEVDRIVRIPVRSFFKAENYARFRMNLDEKESAWEMPCFIHRNSQQNDYLWGATYRITVQFLELVFGYSTPPVATRPLVEYQLSPDYYTGSRT